LCDHFFFSPILVTYAGHRSLLGFTIIINLSDGYKSRIYFTFITSKYFSKHFGVKHLFFPQHTRVYPKVSGLSRNEINNNHNNKYMLEAPQWVMVANLTRLTHKMAIQLHLVAESCTICNSCSRRPVRKLLDTLSYMTAFQIIQYTTGKINTLNGMTTVLNVAERITLVTC
jgi:hypothetical protein